MFIEMTNNESITRPSDQGSFVLSVFEMIITAQKENITNNISNNFSHGTKIIEDNRT